MSVRSLFKKGDIDKNHDAGQRFLRGRETNFVSGFRIYRPLHEVEP